MSMNYISLYHIPEPYRPKYMSGEIFPHGVLSCPDPYITKIKNYNTNGVDIKPSLEMKKWFKEKNLPFAMTQGHFCRKNREEDQTAVIYLFKKKSDAVMFKMVWG